MMGPIEDVAGRGFAAVALHSPKCSHNIGSVLRSAHCYGAAMVAYTGNRYQQASTDTMKSHRHIPLLRVETLADAIPFNCVPVAVDLVEGAVPLPDYRHPERAMYIFGPEDGTLGEATLSLCRDRVMIPTAFCLNLAVAVSTVLYDRRAKETRRERVSLCA